MTELRNIPIGVIEANTMPYRNALYHRSTFVEGIRKIAARNMMHVSRARKECGYDGDTSTLPDDWIEDVQNHMLLDQGLEPIRENRALMAYATFLPVQIYLCLLYAGVEFYTKMADQSDLYQDESMDTCVDRHAALVQTMSIFRDSFLHPGDNTWTDERAFLATPLSYNAAPELQLELDGYLERTRLKLQDWFAAELAKLPMVQQQFCRYRFLRLCVDRMDAYNDREGADFCASEIEQLSTWMEQSTDTVSSWSVDAHELTIADRLAKCWDSLCPSKPERFYESPQVEESQTPVSFESPVMSSFATIVGNERAPLSHENRHVAYILRANGAFKRLMLALHLLFHEGTHHILGKMPAHGGRPSIAELAAKNQLVATRVEKERGIQGINELVAPFRVAAGLAYEPLRVYEHAARSRTPIRNQTLDDHLAVSGRLGKHRNFRNSVFHVPRDSTDPALVDLEYKKSMGEEPLPHEVVVELTRIFSFGSTEDSEEPIS